MKHNILHQIYLGENSKQSKNECDHDWELKDDSFDHEFGCEQIQYYECVNCEATRDLD